MNSRRLSLCALAAAWLAACATVPLVEVLRDPAFERVAFQNILVVFQSEDPAQRRELEDRKP